MAKKALLGNTLTELQEIVKANGLPAFSAKQIADWLYKKRVTTIEEMTNISAANREKLAEKYCVGAKRPTEKSESKDKTKKYLFETDKNKYVEAVFIPEKERFTLCISSQVGCKMNCLFCATGKQGFGGNLTAGEILNQVQSIDESEQLTNIVFMGMGEPLDNVTEVLKAIEIITAEYGYGWSPKRVTLSTSGILPHLKTFLDQTQCNLAISLHSASKLERKELMPIEKTYAISEVINLVKLYDWNHQRRISFEYILFNELNDTEEQALLLAEMLRHIDCRVNLIPYHPIPEVGLTPSSRDKIENFQRILTRKHITTTIRRSRGQDIDAACGMLSTKKLKTV